MDEKVQEIFGKCGVWMKDGLPGLQLIPDHFVLIAPAFFNLLFFVV